MKDLPGLAGANSLKLLINNFINDFIHDFPPGLVGEGKPAEKKIQNQAGGAGKTKSLFSQKNII